MVAVFDAQFRFEHFDVCLGETLLLGIVLLVERHVDRVEAVMRRAASLFEAAVLLSISEEGSV